MENGHAIILHPEQIRNLPDHKQLFEEHVGFLKKHWKGLATGGILAAGGTVLLLSGVLKNDDHMPGYVPTGDQTSHNQVMNNPNQYRDEALKRIGLDQNTTQPTSEQKKDAKNAVTIEHISKIPNGAKPAKFIPLSPEEAFYKETFNTGNDNLPDFRAINGADIYFEGKDNAKLNQYLEKYCGQNAKKMLDIFDDYKIIEAKYNGKQQFAIYAFSKTTKTWWRVIGADQAVK
jgi:hypothetical protein